MRCSKCGYDEDDYNAVEFVGIFANGTGFSTTDGEMCGLYGCPRCNTVQYTTDVNYIQKRKEEFKKKMKDSKRFLENADEI